MAGFHTVLCTLVLVAVVKGNSLEILTSKNFFMLSLNKQKLHRPSVKLAIRLRKGLHTEKRKSAAEKNYLQ